MRSRFMFDRRIFTRSAILILLGLVLLAEAFFFAHDEGQHDVHYVAFGFLTVIFTVTGSFIVLEGVIEGMNLWV